MTTPKRIVDLLRVIEDENNLGSFSIEINLRPELFGRVTDLVKTHFLTYNGDFHDLTSSEDFIKELPSISFENAEAGSSSLRLGPEDGRTRRFVYKSEGNQTEAFLETSSESGEEPDLIRLSSLDQRTFSILASIYAAPLVSIDKGRKKIGMMLDGSSIDVKNWECLRDYLHEMCSSEGLSVFLLIFTGKPGTIGAMYSENVDRIGIYSPGIFTRTNSYRKSIDIIHYMVESLRSSTPNAPVLFFLGAGASIEAGLPPTRELMETAMKRILRKPDGSDIDFDTLVIEMRHKIASEGLFLTGENELNLKITFERVMTEELRHCHSMSESPTLQNFRRTVHAKTPSVAHFNLARLVRSAYKPIFMTANYDDIFERSLESFGTVKTFYRDSDFREAETCAGLNTYIEEENAEIPLFKFHGTINDFDSIKASVQDTLSLAPNKNIFFTNILNGNLFREIIPQFEDSTIKIIFIGYSFNDRDITSVIGSIQESGGRLHIYTVNPNQRMCPILRRSRSMIQDDYMNCVISLPFSVFAERMRSMLAMQK